MMTKNDIVKKPFHLNPVLWLSESEQFLSDTANNNF